ncbi:MAG: MaoC/PaaZ C-terminal domain-containing protein [Bacteroidales bacterium]
MNFKIYLQTKTNTYLEFFGLPFDDFKVGQKFAHRPGITISQQDNKDEALDTINSAQLHYDSAYAHQTEWKNCLGVSTLTVQKVIGMTSKTFFRKANITRFDNIAMTHPVFDGDTLYAETEILEKTNTNANPECGTLKVKTTGINQKNQVVTTLVYDVSIYKKGQHPIEKMYHNDFTEVNDDKFNGYKTTKDGKFQEETGIFYEDFIEGETYLHQPGKTFTEGECLTHSLRSLDWNPLYIDKNLTTNYLHNKSVLINPSYLVGAATALSTRTCGRVVANLAWENIQLLQAINVGDTIYAETEVLNKRESKSRPDQGIMHVETRARNQNKDIVLSYERIFLIYKTGKGPYGIGNY